MSNAETNPVIPFVNWGSSREDLKAQQRAVHDDCVNLTDHLRAAAPHSRDYHGSPEGTYEKTRKQWEVRLRAVEEIRQESLRVFRVIDKSSWLW